MQNCMTCETYQRKWQSACLLSGRGNGFGCVPHYIILSKLYPLMLCLMRNFNSKRSGNALFFKQAKLNTLAC